MQYIKQLNHNEFNNIVKHNKIFSIISPKDLNWNININEYIDKLAVEIIEKNNDIFALVSITDDFSKYKVYFIAYVDMKDRLRAYIPKHGNLYNPWTASHFGNESIYDEYVSLKSITRMPEKYYEEDEETGNYKETEQYKIDFEQANLKENKDSMINEFLYFYGSR